MAISNQSIRKLVIMECQLMEVKIKTPGENARKVTEGRVLLHC